MCSSLSLFNFKIKAEILAHSKSFEAHPPGSVKLRVSARTPLKQRSFFKGAHLIRFPNLFAILGLWRSGRMENQEMWKRSEVSTAGLKEVCRFTERNKIRTLRSIYPLRVEKRGYLWMSLVHLISSPDLIPSWSSSSFSFKIWCLTSDLTTAYCCWCKRHTTEGQRTKASQRAAVKEASVIVGLILQQNWNWVAELTFC